MGSPSVRVAKVQKVFFQPVGPAPVVPQPTVAAPPPSSNLGMLFALASVFVTFSFLHEIIGVTVGVRSFLPPIFGVPAIVAFVISGGLIQLWRNSTSRLFLIYTAWLVLALPFSSWPGGSLEVLKIYFEAQFLPFLLIGGMVRTVSDLRRMMYVFAFAGLVNELSARYIGAEDANGRLNMGSAMSISNSNDFAAQLLMILPIFWFAFMNKSLPFWIRTLFLLAIPYGLSLSLRTGSRGALIGMIVAYVSIIIITKGAKRFLVAATLPVLGMAIFAAIPGQIGARLATTFNSDNGQNEEARESATGRKYLVQRSLDLTVEHPMFGVGPGEFGNAEGGESIAKGKRGAWSQTHNSYTQVSSEEGIPAAVFLAISLFLGLRNAFRVRRQAARQGNRTLELAACALVISAAGFCASAFFLSLALRFYFPALVGLLAALSQVAQNELGPAAVSKA